MRANILLPFGLSVALSSAQVATDFSSLTAGPVTSSTLNSVTTGGSWYLNPDRDAVFEIQEEYSASLNRSTFFGRAMCKIGNRCGNRQVFFECVLCNLLVISKTN